MNGSGLKGIVLLRSSENRLISIDGPVEEITGHPRDDFIEGNLLWEDLVEEKFRDSVMAETGRLLQTPGAFISNIYNIQDRNDRRHKVQEISRSFAYDSGGPVYLHSAIVEIPDIEQSAIVKAEGGESLEAPEGTYRRIMDSSPDAVIESDLDGNITTLSSSTLELFGYKQNEEVAGKNFLDLIAREDRERAIRNLKTIQEKGKMLNVEYTFIQNSGRRLIGVANTALKKSPGQNPSGYVITIRDASRQKKAEWTLKSNHDLLRGITEAAKDSIMLVNDKKQVTFWNPASEELFGYSINEMLGRPVEVIIKADEAGHVQHVLDSLASTRESGASDQLIEIQARKKDGSMFPAEMAISGFFSETRWNIVIVVREISDRKALERERVSLIRDLNERIKELNCLFKLSEIVEEPHADIPRIIDGTLSLLPGAFQHPESTCAEIIFNDKEYCTPEFTKTGLCITEKIEINKEVQGAITVYYTGELPETGAETFLKEEKRLLNAVAERLGRIIERIDTESALLESEERFRDLFENTSDLIQNVNPDGRFIYVNPAWKTTLGYSGEEIENLTLFDVIHPDCIEKCMDIFKSVLGGETVSMVRATFVKKDGAPVEVEGSASCRFENGKPVSTRGIFRNISDKTEKEDRFLKTNMELKRFTSSLSHDLKGTFTAIDTANENLKYLLELPPQEENRSGIIENAGIISKGIREATDFVNDLLSLSRSGQPPSELEEVRISNCVDTAELELMEMINSTKTRVIKDSDFGTIRADEGQMNQLFTNLLAYLLKNNDNPDPIIELRFNGSDSKGALSILASNNGSGIPLEQTESIFDPSFDGENGKVEINLPVVDRIVNTYGGSIEIADCEGSGFVLAIGDYEL